MTDRGGVDAPARDRIENSAGAESPAKPVNPARKNQRRELEPTRNRSQPDGPHDDNPN